MPFDQRVTALDQALVHALPESQHWPRSVVPMFPLEHERYPSYLIEVPINLCLPDRRLRIQLGPDGDVQVEYHIADERGSPYEFLYPLPEGEETQALAEVADDVSGLVSESLAVAMERNWLGGRALVKTGDMTGYDRRRYLWISSLRGTYDWREKSR